MAAVDILLTTFNRPSSLAMTLAGIAGQTWTDYRIIIADQSERPVVEDHAVNNLLMILELRGGEVDYHHREPVHGIAEQRDFLLNQAAAPYLLYIDDDVWLEHWVLAELIQVIQREKCGFVGAFPFQPQYRNDIRPHQQVIEFWDTPVYPEALAPGSSEWKRADLHHAANLYHACQRLLKPGEKRIYKVAWVASCILYDRDKLNAVGGFEFWPRLPRFHSGEEVLVQNLLLRCWGGCAIAPSGAYSSEMPSTVLNDAGLVDGHALDLLPEMIQRYSPERMK